MITLEELATKVDELERKVAKLSDDGEAQDRFNARLLGMVEEVRDDVSVVRADVSLLRRHSVAMGQKIEELDARLSKLDANVASISARVDKLDANLTTVSGRVDRLDANFTAFQRGLPAMIADTMREVQRESEIKFIELMRATLDERDRRRR